MTPSFSRELGGVKERWGSAVPVPPAMTVRNEHTHYGEKPTDEGTAVLIRVNCGGKASPAMLEPYLRSLEASGYTLGPRAWGAALRCAADAGSSTLADTLHESMLQNNIPIDGSHLTHLIKANRRRFPAALHFFRQFKERGITINASTRSVLARSVRTSNLSEQEKWDFALRLLEEEEEDKGVVLCEAVKCARSYQEALELCAKYGAPEGSAAFLTRGILIGVATVCRSTKNPEAIEKIWFNAERAGITLRPLDFAMMMASYGTADHAQRLWKLMRKRVTTQIPHTVFAAFISCCKDDEKKAEKVFSAALQEGFMTKVQVWVALLGVYEARRNEDDFVLLFSRMQLLGMTPPPHAVQYREEIRARSNDTSLLPHDPEATQFYKHLRNAAAEPFEDLMWKRGSTSNPQSLPLIGVL